EATCLRPRPALPALVVLLVIVGACGSRPPIDERTYIATISAARAAKDAELTNAADSPVPANRRAELLPLVRRANLHRDHFGGARGQGRRAHERRRFAGARQSPSRAAAAGVLSDRSRLQRAGEPQAE